MVLQPVLEELQQRYGDHPLFGLETLSQRLHLFGQNLVLTTVGLLVGKAMFGKQTLLVGEVLLDIDRQAIEDIVKRILSLILLNGGMQRVDHIDQLLVLFINRWNTHTEMIVPIN